MTFGNISDATQQLDISKSSIGFIPDIGSVSKNLLKKHLVTHTRHSKSSADVAIREFGRVIEHSFWKMCFEPLLLTERTGCKMYILGRGITNVHVRVAFFQGDDPAVHRHAGVVEANGLRTCIRCNYSLKRDGWYNIQHQVVRDPYLILDQCELAQSGVNKKVHGIPMLHQEKEALSWLKQMGLHYIKSAMFMIDMGKVDVDENNHVFRGPCDILHTFACGLCKNLVLWTVSIVMATSKLGPPFSFSEALFDARIASMKDWVKLANVTTTYFGKGICFISKGKSAAEKAQTSGGGGGFRSCEYIPLLLYMYMAIGVRGDVLPNVSHFGIPGISDDVGNVTQIVLTSISTMLDAYFALRTSPLTEDRIESIDIKLQKMSSHFIVMFQLMRTFAGDNSGALPQSRKLHAAVCNIPPFLKTFGTMMKADTASFESIHRDKTVALWLWTSKR
jgi:hypothetical protein